MAGDNRFTVTGVVSPAFSACADWTNAIGPEPAAAGDARLSMITDAVQAAAPAIAARLRSAQADRSPRPRGGRVGGFRFRHGRCHIEVRNRRRKAGSYPVIRTTARDSQVRPLLGQVSCSRQPATLVPFAWLTGRSSESIKGVGLTELPSGPVTFLFTDIEASTRLWEEHPDEMRDALARHDGMLRGAIEAHGGYLVKTTGDGCMAAFSAADAGCRRRSRRSGRWTPKAGRCPSRSGYAWVCTPGWRRCVMVTISVPR